MSNRGKHARRIQRQELRKLRTMPAIVSRLQTQATDAIRRADELDRMICFKAVPMHAILYAQPVRSGSDIDMMVWRSDDLPVVRQVIDFEFGPHVTAQDLATMLIDHWAHEFMPPLVEELSKRYNLLPSNGV